MSKSFIYCAVLCCAALCCAVLCCAVLFCTVRCGAVRCGAVRCVVPCCISLCYWAVHCIPCDRSLPAQPIILKAQPRNKIPHTFAHLVNFYKNVCHLIIIQSCSFDYRIRKLFACSPCVICISCSVHFISTYYLHKGSWAFTS